MEVLGQESDEKFKFQNIRYENLNRELKIHMEHYINNNRAVQISKKLKGMSPNKKIIKNKKQNVSKAISTLTYWLESRGNEQSQFMIMASRLNAILPIRRKVKIDGNCFYRAIAFTYLEYLLTIEGGLHILTRQLGRLNQRTNNKNKLIILISLIFPFPHFNPDMQRYFELSDSHRTQELFVLLVQLIKDICDANQMKDQDQKNFKSVQSILERYFNQNPVFDVAMINLMRTFAYEALIKLGEDKNVSTHLFNGEFQKYKTQILTYDQEATGIVLDLMAQSLQADINIYNVDLIMVQPQGTQISNESHPQSANSSKIVGFPSINLFYKPNSYYYIGYESQHANLHYSAILKDEGAKIGNQIYEINFQQQVSECKEQIALKDKNQKQYQTKLQELIAFYEYKKRGLDLSQYDAADVASAINYQCMHAEQLNKVYEYLNPNDKSLPRVPLIKSSLRAAQELQNRNVSLSDHMLTRSKQILSQFENEPYFRQMRQFQAEQRQADQEIQQRMSVQKRIISETEDQKVIDEFVRNNGTKLDVFRMHTSSNVKLLLSLDDQLMLDIQNSDEKDHTISNISNQLDRTSSSLSTQSSTSMKIASKSECAMCDESFLGKEVMIKKNGKGSIIPDVYFKDTIGPYDKDDDEIKTDCQHRYCNKCYNLHQNKNKEYHELRPKFICKICNIKWQRPQFCILKPQEMQPKE